VVDGAGAGSRAGRDPAARRVGRRPPRARAHGRPLPERSRRSDRGDRLAPRRAL